MYKKKKIPLELSKRVQVAEVMTSSHLFKLHKPVKHIQKGNFYFIFEI